MQAILGFLENSKIRTESENNVSETENVTEQTK